MLNPLCELRVNRRVRDALSSEEREEKCEKNTQNNGSHDRKREREVPSPYHDVAGKAAERNAEQDQQADARNTEADVDKESTHSYKVKVRSQKAKANFGTFL